MITTDTEKTSLGKRIALGLKRTRQNLAGLFTGANLDDAFFEELEDALLATDAGVAATGALLDQLREKIAINGIKTLPAAKEALADIIEGMMRPMEKPFEVAGHKPAVIMLAGVNGAGKTTTIGKITHLLKNQNLSVVLGAGDTFRAAASEQLAVWGEKNGVKVVRGAQDPAAAAFDAVKTGVTDACDVVIVDTAGRLSTQARLMAELNRIYRVQAKALEGAPHEVILVIDGTNGQNALNQVEAFDLAAPLTGLIVTKLDGSAKGGAMVALSHARREHPIPIYFIGIGEGIDDMEVFDAHAFSRALLDL